MEDIIHTEGGETQVCFSFMDFAQELRIKSQSKQQTNKTSP